MRLLLAVLLILTSPVALAIEVQGEGSSLEEALNNAFKVAIDNEVGVILDTERHLRNGEVVHNQILSYSAGYVTTYEIIHHIHIRDRNIHQVTVDVTVASSKLKNYLLSSNHNAVSFNVDNIKAQIRLVKKGQVDGQKLVSNFLKSFPREAINIQTHDLSVVGDYHNPEKFYLQIPYTVSWNKEYLIALQELLTLFKVDQQMEHPIRYPSVAFTDADGTETFFTPAYLMRDLKEVFFKQDFVLLNINSLLTDISINSCVQNIRTKGGRDSTKALYRHVNRAIQFMTDRTADSFVLFPIEENNLHDFQGLTKVTLSVSAPKDCPNKVHYSQ